MRSRGMACEEEQVYMRYCNIEDKKGYKARPRTMSVQLGQRLTVI